MSEARMTWIGARAMGTHQLNKLGSIEYWADGAIVRGTEERVHYT
jgi:hypothetical protein